MFFPSSYGSVYNGREPQMPFSPLGGRAMMPPLLGCDLCRWLRARQSTEWWAKSPTVMEMLSLKLRLLAKHLESSS